MRTYGEACSVARALDLVGERWTLLIVRELLIGPKRFTDLQAGLPGVPSSLLGARLAELRQAGLVEQRRLPPPAASMVYELTLSGTALEETITALGRWGARFGRERATSDSRNHEWLLAALRSLFRPDAGKGLQATYELRFGDDVVTAEIVDGELRLSPRAAADPGAVLELDGPTFMDIATGKATADEALATGTLRLEGSRASLDSLFMAFGAEPRRSPVTIETA
jgi:DNA-binding HxlR family transcriptional regulator/putative sterol carrier protein